MQGRLRLMYLPTPARPYPQVTQYYRQAGATQAQHTHTRQLATLVALLGPSGVVRAADDLMAEGCAAPSTLGSPERQGLKPHVFALEGR
jgi:hypothetical protein